MASLDSTAACNPEQSVAAPISEAAVGTRSLLGRLAAMSPQAVVVMPLVVVAVVLLARGERFAPNFDIAALDLGLQDASRGEQLLGPYSRFGWNHPGPLVYYAAVPWYHLLDHNGMLAMSLGRLTIDAACLGLIVALIDRIGGRAAAWGAAAGIAWFELRVGLDWFRNPWNPYAIVLPTALALVAAASLLDGRGTRWRVILLVVAGSFAVQAHFGAAPLVALAFAVGIVGIVRSARHRCRKDLTTDLAIAAAVGLACWALPIWEQLIQSPGNARELAAFLVNPPDGRPGLGTVMRMTTVAFTLPADHTGSLLGGEPMSHARLTGLAVVTAVVLVGVAVWVAMRSWRAGRTSLGTLAALVPLGYLVAAIGGLQIRGDVAPYLFAGDLAVGLLAFLTAGIAVAIVASRVARSRAGAAAPFLAAVAVATAGTSAWVGSDAFDPMEPTFANTLATNAAPAVREICRADQPVRLTTGSAVWYDYLALAATIGECAPDVRLERHAGVFVGDRRIRPLSRGLVVRVEVPGVPRTDGWQRLSDDPGMTIDVRELPREQRQRTGVADRLYLLERGRLIAEGPAEEFRNRHDVLETSYFGHR